MGANGAKPNAENKKTSDIDEIDTADHSSVDDPSRHLFGWDVL